MATALHDPAAVFHSLSDATRLRLLRLLRRQELNVQEMVRILGMNQPRVSKHLAVLRENGWLRQRKEGTRNWYRTVGREAFPAGAPLYDSVLAAADQVGSAGEDDAVLARLLTERDARAQDFFAGIAGKWDRIRQSYEHTDIQLGAVSALVDVAQRVIDIGTGTGALLPVLAGAVEQVIAVDSSEAMLARARALCERSGLSQVHLLRADIQMLPFADDSFDAAYCSMVLHHVARPELALAEMARVVRPAGKAVVIAFTRHNLTWLRDELAHRWLGFDREEIEQLLRTTGLVPQRYLVRHRQSQVAEEYEGRALKSAGDQRKGEAWTWPDVFLAVARKPQAAARESAHET